MFTVNVDSACFASVGVGAVAGVGVWALDTVGGKKITCEKLKKSRNKLSIEGSYTVHFTSRTKHSVVDARDFLNVARLQNVSGQAQ